MTEIPEDAVEAAARAMHALNLACCCGGSLVYAGTSYVAMGSERDAFNRRHADCKPPAPVRDVRYRLQIAGRR